MHRLTFTIISAPMSKEEAEKEFDHAKRRMPEDSDFSAIHGTREVWNGTAWVIEDRLDFERR